MCCCCQARTRLFLRELFYHSHFVRVSLDKCRHFKSVVRSKTIVECAVAHTSSANSYLGHLDAIIDKANRNPSYLSSRYFRECGYSQTNSQTVSVGSVGYAFRTIIAMQMIQSDDNSSIPALDTSGETNQEQQIFYFIYELQTVWGLRRIHPELTIPHFG